MNVADLTMVSLFDGIAGFPEAFRRAGIRTVAAVEIDPAAAGVQHDRFPDITHFDDVMEVTADDLRAAGFVPERGVLTAGWPCQDLSLAGLRAGLDGARSGLFWQIVRLASDLRPRWLCLENVPGLLSAVCPGRSEDVRTDGQGRLFGDDSDDGLTHGRGACPGGCMAAHGGAMGLVLGALAGLGYGYAYRIVDAQHLGVPQRRKRVVIVANLGDWAAPAEVLLEPESLRGDPAAGEAARARTARVLALGAGGGSGTRRFDGRGIVNALTASGAGVSGADDATAQGGHLVTETAYALRRDPGGTGQGHNTTYIAGTLRSHSRPGSNSNGGVITAPATVGALQTGHTPNGHGMAGVNDQYAASGHLLPESDIDVRRLTPLEYERLQGYPDGWTATSDGRPQADSARYRQLGNSIAIPVFTWVALGIADHERDHPREDQQ